MARKTANNAIDFERLFAMKAQLAKQSAVEAVPAMTAELAGDEAVANSNMAEATVALGVEPSGEGEGTAEEASLPSPSAIELPPESGEVAASHAEQTLVPIAVPVEEVTVREEVKAIAAPSLDVERPVAIQSNVAVTTGLVNSEVPTETSRAPLAKKSAEEVMLRVGMSRALHERLRAYAALEGESPTELARRVLDARTPEFPRDAPMAALAKAAREAFATSNKRHRTEVRMQISVDARLHRRLHQLAALRAQTLVASVTDLFEAVIPEM